MTKGRAGLFLNIHQLELGILTQLLIQRPQGVRRVKAVLALWPMTGPAPRVGVDRPRSDAAYGCANLLKAGQGATSLQLVLPDLIAWACCPDFRPKAILSADATDEGTGRKTLKHHVHRPLIGRDRMRYPDPQDQDMVPSVWSFKTGQHPHHRGLSAARRAQAEQRTHAR